MSKIVHIKLNGKKIPKQEILNKHQTKNLLQKKISKFLVKKEKENVNFINQMYLF